MGLLDQVVFNNLTWFFILIFVEKNGEKAGDQPSMIGTHG